MQGLRRAVEPALPHPWPWVLVTGHCSQCWGLGFKPWQQLGHVSKGSLAEQLQAPPLLTHLQAEHLLQHLLPLGLLCQPHPLQLLCIQPQQRPASDGMLGEGLNIDEVVVGTVFLEPLADVLLAPQDYRPCQASQRGARVVQAVVVIQPALWGLCAGLLQELDGPAAGCPLAT